MTRAEEWDWPPTRRRWRYRRTFDVYPPFGSYDAVNSCGWSSPVTKKIINIYWRVMISIIKMMIAIYLTIIAFGASWLLCVLLTL